MANASINATASGDNTVVAAGGTNRLIEVLQYTFITDTDVTVRWKSGSNNISGPMPVSASGGIVSVAAPAIAGDFGVLLRTNANEALVLNLSTTATVGGHITYRLKGV